MENVSYRNHGESSRHQRLEYGNDEINPYPDPVQARPTTLPILRIETDTGELHRPESAPVTSPSQKPNFYHAKKKYSIGEDSLRLRETPVFNKAEKINVQEYLDRHGNMVEFDFQRETRRKKGPSSPTTVLTMAGLFVCGSTLMLSGIIVLCQQDERPFVITGSIFLGLGALMVIICALLQRKNVIKYVLDINRDLYFLKMSDSYMWKLMFRDEDSSLPLPHQQ